MSRNKKLLSLVLMTAITTTMFSTTLKASAEPGEVKTATTSIAASVDDGTTVNENQIPKQVNVHVGDDASTSANFTYTTIEESPSKVVLNKVGDSNKLTFEGTSGVGAGNKYFHGISATGLEPNTKYEYIVGDGTNTFNGTFKTALAKGSKDSFKFVYLADTQVSNGTDAKDLGANFEEVIAISY